MFCWTFFEENFSVMSKINSQHEVNADPKEATYCDVVTHNVIPVSYFRIFFTRRLMSLASFKWLQKNPLSIWLGTENFSKKII